MPEISVDIHALDEPAAGFDPAEVRALRQHLAARAAAGVAVLVSRHQLAEVRAPASHLVVMNRGRLIAAGGLRELLGGAGTLEDAGRASIAWPARPAAPVSCCPGPRRR